MKHLTAQKGDAPNKQEGKLIQYLGAEEDMRVEERRGEERIEEKSRREERRRWVEEKARAVILGP